MRPFSCGKAERRAFFCAPLTQPVVPRLRRETVLKEGWEKRVGVFFGVFPGSSGGVPGGRFPLFFPFCREQHRAAPFCTFSGPFSGECCARSDVFHECSCGQTGKGRRPCVRAGRCMRKKAARRGKSTAGGRSRYGCIFSFETTARRMPGMPRNRGKRGGRCWMRFSRRAEGLVRARRAAFFLWEGGAACFFLCPAHAAGRSPSAPGNGVKGRMGKESGGVFRECLGEFGEIFPYV